MIYLIALHFVALAGIALLNRPDRLARIEQLFDIDPISYSSFDKNSYFAETLSSHRRMDASIPVDSAIFLGDSITQGLATTAIVAHATNYGIGGEDTTELLTAIPFYRSLQHAKTIFLSIGVNDLHYHDQQTLEARLRQIVDALPRNTDLVWSSIMPVYANPIDPPDIAIVNQAIRALCENRGHCVYVDTEALFLDSNNQQIKQDFLDDGVHLSTAGYAKWIRALQHALEGFAD